jgi:hypothetical protein
LKGREKMSILKDIFDTIKDVAATTKPFEERIKDKSKIYSSISQRALQGTLQFPVLVSSALTSENAQIISKSLEKNYAAFVQIALSLNPSMHIENEIHIPDYLQRFHQNIDDKLLPSDIRSLSTTNENCIFFSTDDKLICMMYSIEEGTSKKIFESNIKGLKYRFDDLNLEIANKKFDPGFNYKVRGVNECLMNKYNNIVTEADNKRGNPNKPNVNIDINEILKRADPKDTEKINEIGKALNTTYHEDNKDPKKDAEERADKEAKARSIEIPKDALKWSQTQKLNELMPTQLIIKVKFIDKDNKPAGDGDFIIGIKATLHPIESKEMIANTIGACTNDSKIFNFIRWTTGEIDFFKDFLFNINEIKNDVTKVSSGSSSWWIALKRRRALARIKNTLMIGKTLMPNATLVLSMEEVNYIKHEYGYDLMSPYFLDKIMQTYFLLGFVVVDNSTQIAHFKFDGQDAFQSYRFDALQRENSNDISMVKMAELMRKNI